MNISPVEASSAIAVVSESATPKHQAWQPSQAPSGGEPVNQAKMERIVAKMQEQIDSMNVSLEYSTYGDRGDKIAVTVVNKNTGEVIREIPPREIRDLYAKMNELAGMIFNRQI
jgi:flagellar protein FlaG